MMPVPGIGKRTQVQHILCPSNNSSLTPISDGLTAFYGAMAAAGASGVNAIYVKRACRITEVRLATNTLGTLGTAETATASVRVNDTTDTTISSVVQHDTVFERFDNTALNIALAAGDFFEIKIVYPTFVTNPTTVLTIIEIVLES